MKHLRRFNESSSEQNSIEEIFNTWQDRIDYSEADFTSFKAGYKEAMKYFTSIIPTEKDAEKYANGYYGFPEGQEDYISISASESGFVDGCDWTRNQIENKINFSSIKESIADDYLKELYHKGAISSDVYDITKEEEDLSIFTGTDTQIKKKLLKHLNYVGGISSDVYSMELEELR